MGCEGPAAKAMGVRTAGMGHQRITSLLIRAEKAPHSMVSGCSGPCSPDPISKMPHCQAMGPYAVWKR